MCNVPAVQGQKVVLRAVAASSFSVCPQKHGIAWWRNPCITQVAHFRCSVAVRHSRCLRAPDECQHVLDAVNSIVSNLGPLHPAVEAMLYQQQPLLQAPGPTVRILLTINCPKLGIQLGPSCSVPINEHLPNSTDQQGNVEADHDCASAQHQRCPRVMEAALRGISLSLDHAGVPSTGISESSDQPIHLL